jgi:hypothetical protein
MSTADYQYTSDEIYERLRSWIESHNPEFNWDWTDPQGIRREMLDCAQIGGAFNLEELFKLF